MHGSLVKISPPLTRQRSSQVWTKVETVSSKETETETTWLLEKDESEAKPKLDPWRDQNRRVAVELEVVVELSVVVGSAIVVFPARDGSVTLAVVVGSTGGKPVDDKSGAVDVLEGGEGASAAHAAGASVRLIEVRISLFTTKNMQLYTPLQNVTTSQRNTLVPAEDSTISKGRGSNGEDNREYD